MLTEASSAGVGRNVIDLCAGLLATGHELELVYAPGREDESFRHGLAELRQLGMPVTSLAMRRAPHPSDRLALRAVKQILLRAAQADQPFDIIHGQSSKGGAIARLAGAKSSAAVVYTPHCVYTLNPTIGRVSRLLFGGIERLLAKKTDAAIAVSPTEKAHLEELGFSNVHCVPNGLRDMDWPARKDVRTDLGLPEDAQVCVAIARLSPQKDPLLLINAFARVADEKPTLRLVLAGTGELAAACEARVRELGLEERVLMPGYRTPMQILPAGDVFVLSSRYEGMPYVFLEALSYGLPIVTTAVGGTELVVPQRGSRNASQNTTSNGCVVPVGDEAALAAALSALFEDDALRAQMAAASRDLGRKFSLERMLAATLEVYGLAMAKRARRKKC